MVWASMCTVNSELYSVRAVVHKAVETDKCEWEQKLEAWLLEQVQPKIECALVCENTALRYKVNELRREIDSQLDIHDNLRRENTKLRVDNDQLRRDNQCLQL